jgi:hypothetical protein
MLPPPGLEHVVPVPRRALASAVSTLGGCFADELLTNSATFGYQPFLQETAELIRKNAELMVHMAMLKENAALAMENARLEELLRAPNVGSEVKRLEGAMDCTTRKEKRRQWMQAGRELRLSTGQRSRTTEPRVPLGSGLTSVAKENDNHEAILDESQVKRESPMSTHQHSGTVAIMQNVPPEYTRESLLEIIDQNGFVGSYDFFYLPMTFETELNHGYAFINFTTPHGFERFREGFDGFSDWTIPSDRICEVSFCDKFRNLDDCIEAHRNVPIMHFSVEDRFKPVILANGERVPFPEPTKKVRAPRYKKTFHPISYCTQS